MMIARERGVALVLGLRSAHRKLGRVLPGLRLRAIARSRLLPIPDLLVQCREQPDLFFRCPSTGLHRLCRSGDDGAPRIVFAWKKFQVLRCLDVQRNGFEYSRSWGVFRKRRGTRPARRSGARPSCSIPPHAAHVRHVRRASCASLMVPSGTLRMIFFRRSATFRDHAKANRLRHQTEQKHGPSLTGHARGLCAASADMPRFGGRSPHDPEKLQTFRTKIMRKIKGTERKKFKLKTSALRMIPKSCRLFGRRSCAK